MNQEPVAIVGMAIRLPGAGQNLDRFWQAVATGEDCSQEVPPHRWQLPPSRCYDPRPAQADCVYCTRGYFLEPFEPHWQGLDLDPVQAAQLDPLVQLVLDVGNRAWRSAQTEGLQRRAGVVLGNICLPTEGSSALCRALLRLPPGTTVSPVYPDNRRVAGFPAALLAQALRLGRGGYALDAACASSLYAIYLAVRELQTGRADAMLAGGCSRPDSLYTQMGFAQLRALSLSGRCAPFDASADGLLVGEGAALFVLKRLRDALRDGDVIHAVIRGIGLSNDRAGNLLAPAREGQVRAMRRAYEQAQCSPHQVDYIECHATGTPVGDAVEWSSLRELWGQAGWRSGQCVLSSVKATVGHLLTGAGAAALAKVLLALRHRQLPPQANFTRPAAQLTDYASSPFRILRLAEPWDPPGGRPRRAAVSGFGFGGINAHLILEEWTGQTSFLAPPTPQRHCVPVAIVGLASRFGPWHDAAQLREALQARQLPPMTPKTNGWGWAPAECPPARAIEMLEFPADRFRIPPREVEETLPQQLLMLQVADEAMLDSQQGQTVQRPRQQIGRLGVFIGLELDANTMNFHLRWSALAAEQPALADRLSPPLNANRTMGALGSIAASRIARALTADGPSFVLCNDEASAARAAAVAVQALQDGEVDVAVVGGVDLAADPRLVLAASVAHPGEGAAAFVLKRLADAQRDGDAIYAVLVGLGSGSSQEQALAEAIAQAGWQGHERSLIHFHTAEVVGSCGAASAAADLAAAALLLSAGRTESSAAVRSEPALSPRRGIVTAACCTSHLALLLEEYAPSRSPRLPRRPPVPVRALCLPVGAPPQLLRSPYTPLTSLTTLAFEPLLAAYGRWHEGLLAAQSSFLRTQQGWLTAAARLVEWQQRMIAHRRLVVETATQPCAQVEQAALPVPVGLDTGVGAEHRAAGELEVPRSLGYEQCCTFAAGKIADVLGPRYAVIDTFPTRVRLPDGPLQLVDRILQIEGEPLSLQAGRVVTEHTVHPGRWYLEADRIPTALSVEAGQADLFLSAFLGIDLRTRGEAVYRLLDAVVTFHRGLPRVGETIRYDIAIDEFVQQGDAWLFRFRFDGTVAGQPFITMRHGTAGFFTPAALAAGKGIVQTALDRQPRSGRRPADWRTLAPLEPTSLDEQRLTALRQGDLETAFGPSFAGLPLRQPRTLPGGPLRLLDRVPVIDLQGGRFGLGLIRGELDIHPQDWFLTCHFVDDPVMPGTLMYECCLQTLRVGLLRLGWIGEAETTAYEPVPGVASRLKCRGQVVPTTRTTAYEVAIKELGYHPEPYCLADALMYADGKPIVEITNLSLQLTGLRPEEVERLWESRRSRTVATIASVELVDPAKLGAAGASTSLPPPRLLYNSRHILAFSNGKPSEAFGEPYRVFDEGRIIARLPGPPYQFLDGITAVEGPPFVLQQGANCEAVYDVPPSAWYFEEQRSDQMPYCVLLEIALQPCGWLAAYCGSALYSDEDLSFRNLGGSAVQHRPVTRRSGRLTTRTRLTRFSRAAGMIIEHFAFEVRDVQGPVYTGQTYFGFFTRAALQQQVGLRDVPAPACERRGESRPFPAEPPFPGSRLRMVERIEQYEPSGGRHGLGRIAGSISVDPSAWFFQAHFYQDPVWPGSLGLQSLLQLLQFVAQQRWGEGVANRSGSHRRGEGGSGPVPGVRHEWTYRGQIVPGCREVMVLAEIKAVEEEQRQLTADGLLLVDGRPIYRMQEFSWKA